MDGAYAPSIPINFEYLIEHPQYVITKEVITNGKFIIESYPNNGYESKTVETVKKNLKEIVDSYLPKKDVRIIFTSVGYNK